MKEKLTVSDNNSLGLYKRIVDNACRTKSLNHQNEFTQDYLCVGLTETFKKWKDTNLRIIWIFFLNLYAVNFEAKEIKEISNKTQNEFKDKSSKYVGIKKIIV